MPSESSHRLPRTCQRSNRVIFLGVSPITTAHLPDGNSFFLDFKRLGPPPPSLAFALLIKHETLPSPMSSRGSPEACLRFSSLLRHPFAWGGVSTEPSSLGGSYDVRVFKVTELGSPSPGEATVPPFTLARSEGILGILCPASESVPARKAQSSLSLETISEAGIR